ncbi:MAG: VanZ family protein, partial [Acidobacteriaceae bacterium]
WRALLALHIRVSYVHLQWLNFILRKSGHFIGYGVLGVLFVRAWLLTTRSTLEGHPPIARALVLGLFCTFLVASADELHQHFLPGRTGAVHDVALDMLGAALLASLFAKTLQRRASK